MEVASKQRSEEPSSTRKRKRKTYSCVDCRRRKLKCDREHPCSRCIKEAHPQSCVFRDDGHNSEADEDDGACRQYPVYEVEISGKRTTPLDETPATSHGTFPIDQTVGFQRKITLLEAKLAKYEAGNQTQEVHTSVSSRLQDKETRFFKGRSFRTQFYGPTNPTSLFAHYPEVFAASKDSKRSCPMTRVQKDLIMMRNRRKERKKSESRPVEDGLASLLPSRATIEHLIQLYFDTYETTLRVIHIPTFWTEYQNHLPMSQWREPFIAVILTIIASVSCVAVSELSFKDDVSTARVAAQRWIAAVDKWWNRQSQKHLTIETFQVAILLLLAKNTNALKRKRAWADSGAILRLAISAGFQREPSECMGKISVFDQEMRRRIWATVFEWDLAASISRGVSSMAVSIPSDCRAPLNINDAEMDKDSQHLPESRPSSERTDTSFPQVSLQSLSLRTSLTSLLNDPNVHTSWSEVLSYEERIQQELKALPLWVCERNSLSAVILDLQIRQFILWLYAKNARGEPGPRTTYARMACVNASAEIVEMYQKLGAANVNALNMLRSDMYQCIITISLNLLEEAKNVSMASSLINILQPVCEKAFMFLEDKVLKVGEGYNHMWFASAAFATAQTVLDPKLGESKAVAVERVAKIYCKILAHQEIDPELAPGQTSSNNGNNPSNGTITNASRQTTPPTSGGGETPTGNLDILKNTAASFDFAEFPEMASWTNDDFFSFDVSML